MFDDKTVLNENTSTGSNSDKPKPRTQDEFNKFYNYVSKRSVFLQRPTATRQLKGPCILDSIKKHFPVVAWLPKYSFKTNILSDFKSGVAVAVMHLSLGMSYAQLSEVPAIVGVYMAIFPTLVYFLMGTSHHVSLGSFSTVALQTRVPIYRVSNITTICTTNPDGSYSFNCTRVTLSSFTPIQVGMMVSFTTGMLQVIMGLCNIGSLYMFLSESLVSAFSSATVVILFSTQIQYVVGVTHEEFPGTLGIYYTLYDLYEVVEEFGVNYFAVGISTIVILSLNVVEYFPSVTRFFPLELVILIVSIFLSFHFDLRGSQSINILGDDLHGVPSGLPSPALPPIDVLPHIFLDSIFIALVSYSINVSIVNLFALKENYRIDANQELVASGCGNMVGGFFSCLPIAVSLSRSIVQYQYGGKTQIVTIFSCLILLTVLEFFTKCLEYLPHPVLAAIVINTLQSVFINFKNVPSIFRRSKTDGIIWVVTFCSVIIFGVETGLVLAFIASISSIILLNQLTYVSLLGNVPETDLYLEIERYTAACPIPGFIIVQIFAGLHFANVHVARNRIEDLIEDSVREELHTLIIAMSAVSFIDPAALTVLTELFKSLEEKDINVCLASCTGRVYEQMKRCSFFDEHSTENIFPNIKEAVDYINNTKRNNGIVTSVI